VTPKVELLKHRRQLGIDRACDSRSAPSSQGASRGRPQIRLAQTTNLRGPASGTRDRDALRLLFLLKFAGSEPSTSSPGVVTRIVGQMRLQAMDFWLRNPDYLADELITESETGGGDEGGLRQAQRILDSDEPEIRRIPMIRWFFGAYEPLDDSFAVLRANGLADLEIMRTLRAVRGYEFYLLQRGDEAVTQLLDRHPELGWYRDRATVVGRLAGRAGGAALKKRQYAQATYEGTPLGGLIPSIAPRVRSRLSEIRAR
jgi:hypothetical protein